MEETRDGEWRMWGSAGLLIYNLNKLRGGGGVGGYLGGLVLGILFSHDMRVDLIMTE